MTKNKLKLNNQLVTPLSVTQYAEQKHVSVQWVRELCAKNHFTDGSISMKLGDGPHVIFVPIEKK